MKKLQKSINFYTTQLQSGAMQEAYRGIIKSFVMLKQALNKECPALKVGALYQGYLDMSYLPLSSEFLASHQLKIAVVYLHKEGRYEGWLSGTNRTVQAKMIERFQTIDKGEYKLSKCAPGVDSILETILVSNSDFDDMEQLVSSILSPLNALIDWIETIL